MERISAHTCLQSGPRLSWSISYTWNDPCREDSGGAEVEVVELMRDQIRLGRSRKICAVVGAGRLGVAVLKGCFGYAGLVGCWCAVVALCGWV